MGFLKWCRKRLVKTYLPKEEEVDEEIPKENPYLPFIRGIIEQVLEQKGLDYGQMRLLLVDSDEEEASVFEEDKADLVLEKLSAELNYLTIVTNRPAYFESFVERMYEEAGLPVQVEKKENSHKYDVNTVVDLEQQGSMYQFDLKEPSIYIPIYKRSWKTAENLDICVPIGYNTVIVKGFSIVEKRGRV